MSDFDIVFEPEDDLDIVFEPSEPDLGAEIACTGCGRREGIVGATFRDEKRATRAAIACRFCAFVWPQALPSYGVAALLASRAERGAIVEEGR